MRIIGLIIAGSVAAACDGPGKPASNDGAIVVQNEIAGSNGVAMNEQRVPRSMPKPANAETNVHSKPSPCLTQGDDRLRVTPIRAIGTEPFWGARVEGRCVTYSTPENQEGTRVWTRYSEAGDGTSEWVGQLRGKKFEMRVRPEEGCSDGMSDRRYPIAVQLVVDGENREGCAEPL